MSRTTNIVKRIERTRRDELLDELRTHRATHTALGAEKKRLVRIAIGLKAEKKSYWSRRELSRDINVIVERRGALQMVMAGVMAQLDAACDASLWLAEFI